MQPDRHHPILQSIHRLMRRWQVRPEDHIGVGVSGGPDSMVLLHALAALGYPVMALHVNFKLRGQDSDADADLVTTWCREHDISCLVHEADAKAYGAEYGLNTQLAAREIRYGWWAELWAGHTIDWLATGHQLDDTLETFWLHLLRGTGMRGLQGIPARREYIIRPLIDLPAADVLAYAEAFQVPFRIDASNASDDYLRNRIRHHLTPLLEELKPGYRATMQHNLFRLQAEWSASMAASPLSVSSIPDGYHLACPPGGEAYLCSWLEAFGYPWTLSYDFLTARDEHPQGALPHGEWILSRNGPGYFVLHQPQPESPQILSGPGQLILEGDTLDVRLMEILPGQSLDSGPWTMMASISNLDWPLTVRRVEPGDRIQPFGMDGKTKKVSDLLTDAGLTPYQKSRVWVIEAGGEVIWVPGIRTSEKIRIQSDADSGWLFRYSRENPLPEDSGEAV